MYNKEEILRTQNNYLEAVVQRNKDEKEFFKNFIDDYFFVLQELKETKKDLKSANAENDQMKSMKGDPVLLRKTKAELERLKGQASQEQLDTATQMLNLTEARAVLAERNRELERLLFNQQTRCDEAERICREKGEELDEVKEELNQIKSE